jgi:hypothetical protein
METSPQRGMGEQLVQGVIQRGRAEREALALLEVQLLLKTSGPAVKWVLRRPGAPALSGEEPYKDFEANGGPDAPEVPARLAQVLRDALDEALPGQPLWLKLARPYGKLGIVPWEPALSGESGRPVLRLPDYPDRPAQRTVLQHVVLADPPEGISDAELSHKVATLTEALLDGAAAVPAHVHVFTSARRRAPLARFASERVSVHDPKDAASSAEQVLASRASTAPGGRSAPWADWIEQTMTAQGIDAVHLLCRAKSFDAGPQLMLSSSPSPRETLPALFMIEQAELGLLLNRAGAWELTLIPLVPAEAASMAGVADGMTHQRPGAVLFHLLATPEHDASLRGACAFLFAAFASPAPAVRYGFLCCHPSFVQGGPALDANPVARLLTPFAANEPARGTPDPVPGWVAAAQRFVESGLFNEARKFGSDVLLTREGAALASTRPADASSASADTLLSISQAIGDYRVKNPKG